MKDSKSYHNTPSGYPFSNLARGTQINKQPRQGLPFCNHARETQCGVGIKRIILVVMMLLSAGLVFAQKQNGVVKTPGRMVNGKLVPGTLLQGATVQVEGRQAVVAKNGKFSFPVKEGKYTLKSVSKQGYSLVDAEACRQYSYSANPLQILMEEPDKLQSDQLAKERKLRRELQRRIQQREDEIDALNVSVEEKNKLLVQLNKQREENENIIKDMAAYYATLDYDQLDAFQQRVSALLEECQLERADSLLRTRGDIAYRVRQIRTEQETIAREQAALAKRKKSLEESKVGTQRKLEAIAADCYNFYQRFFMAHHIDSAAHYLELRASLDTTNVQWQYDAGTFMHDYVVDYKKAKDYYYRGLRQSQKILGEESHGAAQFLLLLAKVCFDDEEFEKSSDCCQKSLAIFEKLGDTINVAMCLKEIGIFSRSRNNNNKLAIEYFDKALKLLDENVTGEAVKLKCSIVYYTATVLLEDLNYQKAKDMFKKTIEIGEKVFDMEGYVMADYYVMYGRTMLRLQEFDTALFYMKKSVEIVKKVLGENHPKLANIYNSLGLLFSQTNKNDKAVDYYSKALKIYLKVFGEEQTLVAHTYSNLADLSVYRLKKYTEALQYTDKAKKIYEKLYGSKDNNYYCNCVRLDAEAYDNTSQHQKALECYSEAIRITKKINGETHQNVASVLCAMGFSCYKNGDIGEGIKYFSQGKEMFQNTLGPDHPKTKKAVQVLEEMNQKLAEQQSQQTKQRNKKQ